MAYRAPVEALWGVEFGTINDDGQPSIGGGIIVLDSGRLMGGDQGYYYTGSYAVNGDQFSATIVVRRHTHQTDSIFGPVDKFELEGSGSLKGEMKDTIEMRGQIPGTDQWIGARLKWLAELP